MAPSVPEIVLGQVLERYPDADITATVSGVRETGRTAAKALLGLVSADLVGADLSAVNIRNSWLVGAKLGNADLSGSLIEESTFARADLSGTDMSSVTSEHNDYRSAVVSGTNFSNSLLSWDDFSGAVFSNVITDELVVVALVCDGSGGEEVANGNSVRNFGLCTAGSELIF